MNDKCFSKNDAVDFAWQRFKDFWKICIIASIILVVSTILPDKINNLSGEENEISTFLIDAAGLILTLLINIGYTKVAINAANYLPTPFLSLLLTDIKTILKYAAGWFLYISAISAGLTLLIVPGIILAIRLQFYNYYIVENGYGPLESLKKSFYLTKNLTIELFLFYLMLFALNFFGALCLGVGILITFPMSWIANAYVFKQLNKAKKGFNEI